MWKSVFGSAAGVSHEEAGTPCQDAFRVAECDDAGTRCLLIACADGAGSATHSGEGASRACEHFVQRAATAVSQFGVSHITQNLVTDWCLEIRQILTLHAELLDVNVRETACTLLGAVVGSSSAAFCQVGDGAIVIDTEDGYEPLFWPQSGEYANTTNFITDATMPDSLEFALQDRPLHEIAIFTDGLERLILRFAERQVHAPFLVPLFNHLAKADDIEPIFGQLQQFLCSDKVNERTDDDKTLILAIRAQDESDGNDTR